MSYNYPLNLSFKLLAFGPQIFVRDSVGNEVFYVHMKALKLKEAINVYENSSKERVLFTIKADRVIDFSAEYHIADSNGQRLGSIKRQGMKSLFKASYDIMGGDGNQSHHIKEDNGWVRVMDSLLSQIPFVSMFSGYFFHPSYTLYTMGESAVMNLEKQAAFFEGKFSLKLNEPGIDQGTEHLLLMSIMMMTLLERQRG